MTIQTASANDKESLRKIFRNETPSFLSKEDEQFYYTGLQGEKYTVKIVDGSDNKR